MIARIETLIKKRADQPDKGQMIREVVALGLDVLERRR